MKNTAVLFLLQVVLLKCAIVTQLTQIGDDTPLPRENFALVQNPLETTSAFFFGGNVINATTGGVTFYNDLWVINLVTPGSLNYFWTERTTSGSQPSARSFSCLIELQYATNPPLIALFGGSTFVTTSGGNTPVPDLFYFYGPFNNVWENGTADAISDGITPRTGMACATDPLGYGFFVFGGVDSGGNLLDEMWHYSLQTNTFVEKTNFPGTARWVSGIGTKLAYTHMFAIIHGGVSKYPVVINNALNLTQSDILNDTWIYDIGNDNYSQISTVDDIFPNRFGFSYLYNGLTGQFMVYGGNILNSTHLNTTVPTFNISSLNTSYTDCQPGKTGFTIGQLWTYDLNLQFWGNTTLEAQTSAYVDYYVPPTSNGNSVMIGTTYLTIGGVILQCPQINVFYSNVVTSITFF
jgi:hypothetical protein